jgi:hypothetical protein
MGRNDLRTGGEVPQAECHPVGTAATRRARLGPGDSELFLFLLQSGTVKKNQGMHLLRHRARYHVPDAGGILRNGSVAGELAGAAYIEDRFAGPCVGVDKQGVDFGLCLNV